MEFNASKCQIVRVTSSRRPINTLYFLHGQVLEVVTSARYLGVDISSGLSWNSHIDRITVKQGWQKGGKYSYFPGWRELLGNKLLTN